MVQFLITKNALIFLNNFRLIMFYFHLELRRTFIGYLGPVSLIFHKHEIDIRMRKNTKC